MEDEDTGEGNGEGRAILTVKYRLWRARDG